MKVDSSILKCDPQKFEKIVLGIDISKGLPALIDSVGQQIKDIDLATSYLVRIQALFSFIEDHKVLLEKWGYVKTGTRQSELSKVLFEMACTWRIYENGKFDGHVFLWTLGKDQ